MARETAAEKRKFKNKWVCQKCTATQSGGTGNKKPNKCRKCQGKQFRLKKKKKKAGAK
jgi:ribosomal protein L40E